MRDGMEDGMEKAGFAATNKNKNGTQISGFKNRVCKQGFKKRGENRKVVQHG